MFNLEQAITDWRRRMLDAGVKGPVPLDELESHLREDFAVLTSKGKAAAEAFELAASRLGNPAAVQTEFHKIRTGRNWPVTIASSFWIAAAVLMAIIFGRDVLIGKWSFLLATHILCITAGYTAVFLLGIFGICYVCGKSQNSFGRAVYWFSRIAVGLVAVGTLLALPVSEQLFGRYLSWEDPKEIGALCVIGWLAVMVARQRIGQICNRGTLLMCVGGGIVVSLAWFGAAIVEHYQRTHMVWKGIAWPLAVFLAINLAFLAAGLARRNEAAES